MAMAAKSGAAKRNEPATPASGKTSSKPVAVTRSPQVNEDAGFDRLIYERVRLGIMSALAMNEQLTFNELKSLFDVSDGNLSAHARKLEEARGQGGRRARGGWEGRGGRGKRGRERDGK